MVKIQSLVQVGDLDVRGLKKKLNDLPGDQSKATGQVGDLNVRELRLNIHKRKISLMIKIQSLVRVGDLNVIDLKIQLNDLPDDQSKAPGQVGDLNARELRLNIQKK